MHHSFSQVIINWYKVHQRDLPWRREKDPYKIWLSEIILQQTRVAQGLPYYLRFIEAYPTILDLANAPQDEVLRLWQGLGYYSRARNLHFTSKLIATDLNGVFPKKFSEIIKLKGIGDYTAAAIASFAFDEPVAVVDGNVFRVLSRFFGIETDVSSGAGQREFKALASLVLPTLFASIYNQAIMEFGALQCTPVSPSCESCPLQETCVGFKQKMVSQLPVKIKKIKVKERFFSYYVFLEKNQLYLAKRDRGDIWEGLYDFKLNIDHKFIAPNKLIVAWESKEYKHLLTHQRIQAKFYVILERPKGDNYKDLMPFTKNEVENLPKPVLISKFLNDYEHFLFK